MNILFFKDYVLEIEGNLSLDNRLIVNRQWNYGQEEVEPERMMDTQSHRSHASRNSDLKSSLDLDGM